MKKPLANISTKQRLIKKKEVRGIFQMHLDGDFYSRKQKLWALNIDCWSYAYADVNEQAMTNECETNGQGQLGGSDWKLQRINFQELVEFVSE